MKLNKFIEILESDTDYNTTEKDYPVDLNVLNFLHNLCPNHDESKIIANYHEYKLWISTDVESLVKKITEKQACWLRDMGVMYDEDSLCMFV